MPSIRHQVQQSVRRVAGSSFFVRKQVVATSVLTTATNLTTAATGRLYVRNILLETDATGLNSTGNAFTITVSGGTFGSTTIVSQVTSGLGATISLSYFGGATPTTGKQIVLDSGAKLQFQVASSAATGAGIIRMTVEFVRVDDNADCVAA